MHTTREAWLNEAVAELGELFKTEAGVSVPPVAVSCGFPSKSALSRKSKRVGECWDGSCAADNRPQIFVTPLYADRVEVLGVLVHEMVHAAVGCAVGHKGSFKKVAVKMGLEGKMTATTVGPALKECLNALADKLGDYPHSALVASTKDKKQTTRLRKYICQCGVIVRVAKDDFEATCNLCDGQFVQPDGTEV